MPAPSPQDFVRQYLRASVRAAVAEFDRVLEGMSPGKPSKPVTKPGPKPARKRAAASKSDAEEEAKRERRREAVRQRRRAMREAAAAKAKAGNPAPVPGSGPRSAGADDGEEVEEQPASDDDEDPASRTPPYLIRARLPLTAEERAFKRESDRIHAAHPRPRVRGDCLPGGLNEHRPCPFVACRHHLATEVTYRGSLRIVHGHLELERMKDTCSLDVAERNGKGHLGAASLEQIAQFTNVGFERTRQLERWTKRDLSQREDLVRLRVAVEDEPEPWQWHGKRGHDEPFER